MSESAEIAKRKAIQEAGRKYIVTKETAFNVFLGDVELAKEKWYEASDKAKLVYDEEIEKLEEGFATIASLEKLPQALVVVDTGEEEIAVNEAVNKKIPIIGLTGRPPLPG